MSRRTRVDEWKRGRREQCCGMLWWCVAMKHCRKLERLDKLDMW